MEVARDTPPNVESTGDFASIEESEVPSFHRSTHVQESHTRESIAELVSWIHPVDKGMGHRKEHLKEAKDPSFPGISVR
jgi:hypothetical protein